MTTKRNATLQATLDELEQLRRQPIDATREGALSAALSNRSNLVVARAAEIVAEWQVSALIPDLVAAFGRLAEDGVRRDPTCAGKVAIVAALREMDYSDYDFWLAGIRLDQREPSWGPPEDTGAKVRGACALGLARSGYPDVLFELAALLQDDALDTRIGAVRGIAGSGQAGAPALIWHKLLAGDPEPEVYYEGLVALLTLIPEQARPLAARFLRHDRPGVPEVAALALGETQRPEALPYLLDALPDASDPPLRRSLLIAMALLRTEDANAALLHLLRNGSDFEAEAALRALEIARVDEELWDQAQAIYASRTRR